MSATSMFFVVNALSEVRGYTETSDIINAIGFVRSEDGGKIENCSIGFIDEDIELVQELVEEAGDSKKLRLTIKDPEFKSHETDTVIWENVTAEVTKFDFIAKRRSGLSKALRKKLLKKG